MSELGKTQNGTTKLKRNDTYPQGLFPNDWDSKVLIDHLVEYYQHLPILGSFQNEINVYSLDHVELSVASRLRIKKYFDVNINYSDNLIYINSILDSERKLHCLVLSSLYIHLLKANWPKLPKYGSRAELINLRKIYNNEIEKFQNGVQNEIQSIYEDFLLKSNLNRLKSPIHIDFSTTRVKEVGIKPRNGVTYFLKSILGGM